MTQSAVIGSDETSARVAGRTWWQWVFRSVVGVYFLIRASRGAKVIEEVMGKQQAECWVSDCLSAQLKAPARRRQVCLARQLQDIQRLLDHQLARSLWPLALHPPLFGLGRCHALSSGASADAVVVASRVCTPGGSALELPPG